MAKPLSVLVGASLASGVEKDLNAELRRLEGKLNKLSIKASFDGNFQKVIKDIQKAISAVDLGRMASGMGNAAKSAGNMASGFGDVNKYATKATKTVTNLNDEIKSAEKSFDNLNGKQIVIKTKFDDSGQVDDGSITYKDNTGTQRINAQNKAIQKLIAVEKQLASAKREVAASGIGAWDTTKAEAYENELSDIKTKIHSAATELKDFESLTKRLDDLKINIKTNVKLEENWNKAWDKIQAKLDVKDISLRSKFGDAYDSSEYRQIYDNLKNSVKKLSEQEKTWARIQSEIRQADVNARKFVNDLTDAQKKLKKLQAELDIFNNSVGRFAQFYMLGDVFRGAKTAISGMVEQVSNLDTSLVELKKVTDETDSTYSRFMDDAADRAKQLGVSMTDYIDSVTEFARSGFDFNDSQNLAETANIMQMVSENMTGAEASEYLISIIRGFNLEASKSLEIVDSLNNVSNNFAITTDGLGEALKRSSASMKTAGNTLQQTIALVATANETIQNPETVGNAWKTISIDKLVA